MPSERVTSGGGITLLSAAFALLVSACGEQPADETNQGDQGAAPTAEESNTAAATGNAGQATEGAQQQQ